APRRDVDGGERELPLPRGFEQRDEAPHGDRLPETAPVADPERGIGEAMLGGATVEPALWTEPLRLLEHGRIAVERGDVDDDERSRRHALAADARISGRDADDERVRGMEPRHLADERLGVVRRGLRPEPVEEPAAL